jgi:signal transduction histidine kinase
MTFSTDAIFTAPIKAILGEKRRELDDQTFRRLRFLCFAFIVGLSYAGGLFLSDLTLKQKSLYSLALDTWIILTIVFLSIWLRYTTAYKTAFYISVIVIGIVIPAGYFAPTGNRTIFLAPVVLIVAYFLLGRTGGIMWTFFMFTTHLVSYELNHQGIAHLTVSAQSLAYSSLALGIVSVLLFIYEGVNIANERRVAERDKKLREAIDDINKLNEQLKMEKQNVERQVELRTYQLREEQARLQASIATLELGFLMTLQDGTVITYNPALLRICELPTDTPMLSLSLLYSKVGQSYDLEGSIAKCLMTGKSFEATDIQLGERFIRILGSAIRFEDDSEALGAVLLFEDRTAARLLERSEDEFVAIASHELRTPLTVIEGNLSLIEVMFDKEIKDEKMRHMLGSVKESANRMIDIVNQFLMMARLEQRKTVFDLKDIDVMASVNSTLASVRPLVDDKNLQLRVEISPRLPHVKADPGRFQEVLSNLVSNAIKYTEQGYIDVSATHEGKYIVIRVTDTGRGMSPSNQKLLFHKFQQATDNIYTRDESRSTGLGLYITKLLIEQMGGTIELERSEEGKGSTFAFRLPAV